MAWVELTEADVLSALNNPETMAYQTVATRLGQDVLSQVIAQVTDECRGHIGDCARNKLAQGNTLPQRVHYHALAMIRYRLMTRLNLDVSEDRRKEQRDAIAFFYRVSECKVQIEQPDGNAPIDSSGGVEQIELVKSADREFTRRKQNGL